MPDGRRRAVQAEWRSAEQLRPRDVIYVPPFDRWTRIRTVAHRGRVVHLSTDLGLVDFRRADLVRVVPGGATTSLYPNPLAALWAASVLRPSLLENQTPRDLIPGGLAAGRRPEEFDAQELAVGQRVEMEHTTDPRVAREIAMDHLTEDPDYYRKLARLDREAAEIYESVTGRARPERGARMPRKKMTEIAVLHVDAVAAREISVGRRRRRRPEQEMESNPRRPPRQWFRDCVAGVEAGGYAYDPQAVCGAQWQRLSASQKRRHERGRNPYHRYANPWRY